MNKICLQSVAWPEIGRPMLRPEMPDACFAQRLAALRMEMDRQSLDCVAIYADREHYASFKWFLGFEPRFEEGLLVIYRDANVQSVVLLGNECYGMQRYARISVRALLCPYLSLPGQPMDGFVSLEHSLREAGIGEHMRVGLVGWKLITGIHCKDPKHTFCVPSFFVEALREIVGFENLVNATGLLIEPASGLRLVHNVHEIAYLEYGAALASENVANAWKGMTCGKREMELAANMQACGQQLSCHVIFATGENTKKGLVSPGFRTLEMGDAVSFSMGLEGGLSCRGGYAARSTEDLAEDQRVFEKEIVLPYYTAVVAWYETIGLGVTGGEMFDTVQRIIPKEKFGWILNPGHLISFEEWLTSGIAHGNTAPFRSGMVVQMDIIPSVAPCVSPNVEDGVCLADDALQAEIRELYPQMWDRFMKRREYMQNQLGIRLKKEVLPMSNLAARYTPYLLDLEKAFVVER